MRFEGLSHNLARGLETAGRWRDGLSHSRDERRRSPLADRAHDLEEARAARPGGDLEESRAAKEQPPFSLRLGADGHAKPRSRRATRRHPTASKGKDLREVNELEGFGTGSSTPTLSGGRSTPTSSCVTAGSTRRLGRGTDKSGADGADKSGANDADKSGANDADKLDA